MRHSLIKKSGQDKGGGKGPFGSMTYSNVQLLTFLTLNVRGFRSAHKRKKVLLWALNRNVDVILLQETHLTQELEYITNSHWKLYEINYSHGRSNAKGVLIGLSKKLDISDISATSDEQGRMIMVLCTLQGVGLDILNVYAPNDVKTQKSFYKKVSEFLDQNHNKERVLCVGGDFNITMSLGDRKQRVKGRNAIAEAIFEIATKHNMVDVWHQLHPKRRQYTWSRNKGKIGSRLDYWWVQNRLLQKTKTCKIVEALQTDHRAVIWQIKAPLEIRKGPGIWKFNDRILNNDDFCNQIKKIAVECENSPEISAITKWIAFKNQVAQHSKGTF